MSGVASVAGDGPSRLATVGARDTYASVMSALVFLIPITTLRVGSRSLDVGVVMAILLAPLFVPAALASRPTWMLMRLLGLSAVSGVVLAELFTGVQPPDRTYEFGLVALVLAAGIAAAVFAAARRVLSLRRLAGLYAAGALVDGLVNPSLWMGNAWKYALGWPIAVLALSLVLPRGRLVKLVTLSVLGAVGAVYSDRSFLGCCAVAAVFLLLNSSRRRLRLPRSTMARAASVAAVVAVSFGVYEIGSALALDGALGRATQVRTEQRADWGTALIFAGRPEGAATLALAKDQPMGFGPGVTPSSSELDNAKSALAGFGVDPTSDYVNKYMFGGHVEVHSIVGDMWADFGIVGLLTAAYLVLWIVRGAIPAAYLGNPLLTFLAVGALWDAAFSPLPATLMKTVLAFAVLTDDSVRRPEA